MPGDGTSCSDASEEMELYPCDLKGGQVRNRKKMKARTKMGKRHKAHEARLNSHEGSAAEKKASNKENNFISSPINEKVCTSRN